MKKAQGFSLLEVLIFTTILSLVFVTAAALATFSLRNLRSAQNRILATHYSDELKEWLRSEKEKSWTDFIAKVPSGNIRTYCFDASPITSWPASSLGCTADQFINRSATIFKRSVQIQNTDPTMNIVITISWDEGLLKINTVKTTTIFTQLN